MKRGNSQKLAVYLFIMLAISLACFPVVRVFGQDNATSSESGEASDNKDRQFIKIEFSEAWGWLPGISENNSKIIAGLEAVKSVVDLESAQKIVQFNKDKNDLETEAKIKIATIEEEIKKLEAGINATSTEAEKTRELVSAKEQEIEQINKLSESSIAEKKISVDSAQKNADETRRLLVEANSNQDEMQKLIDDKFDHTIQDAVFLEEKFEQAQKLSGMIKNNAAGVKKNAETVHLYFDAIASQLKSSIGSKQNEIDILKKKLEELEAKEKYSKSGEDGGSSDAKKIADEKSAAEQEIGFLETEKDGLEKQKSAAESSLQTAKERAQEAIGLEASAKKSYGDFFYALLKFGGSEEASASDSGAFTSPANDPSAAENTIKPNSVSNVEFLLAKNEISAYANKNLVILKNTQTNAIDPAATLMLRENGITSNIVERKAGLIIGLLPILPGERSIGFTVIKMKNASVSDSNVGAGIIFDSDGDGLPDELEKKIGTDPNSADTDKDSYGDLSEIKNGYNPIGEGKRTFDLSAAEKALIAQVELEEPKSSGIENTNYRIAQIASQANTDASSTILKISGQGPATRSLLLYIYSQTPIIIPVDTDQSGNWSYGLDKDLVDGRHEAYAVSLGQNGNIEGRSAAWPFFIRSAKVVSEDEFNKSATIVQTATSTATTTENIASSTDNDSLSSASTSTGLSSELTQPIAPEKHNNLMLWFLIGGGILLLMLLALFLL